MIRERTHWVAIVDVEVSERKERMWSQSCGIFSSFDGRMLTPEVTTIVAAMRVFLTHGIPTSPLSLVCLESVSRGIQLRLREIKEKVTWHVQGLALYYSGNCELA